MVDVCQYPTAFDVATFWSHNTPVTPSRWINDPVAAKITQQPLDDRTQESPEPMSGWCPGPTGTGTPWPSAKLAGPPSARPFRPGRPGLCRG